MRQQGLRAMVAGANGHAVHVEDARDVVRMHGANIETYYTMMERGICRADDAYELEF